tara:strand:+ start:1352 stop:2239 length:888 start_codon:yes stop_codon:yes gene_type:complete
MGLVVTIANRKGGVGKTTLAIALAETFVFEHKKSAVIVDLDPQSSASEILLSEREYADRLEQQNTLSGFFRSSLSDHKLNISNVLSHAKHSLSGRGAVDLAVAVNSPELWDLEYEVLRSNQELEYRSAVKRAIGKLSDTFDVVIIDCPPGKMMAAEEAVLSSNMVLCPIVPERLSVWGMDKMKEYFSDLEVNHTIPPWRFVISRFVGTTTEAKRQVELIYEQYREHFLTEMQGFVGFRRSEFIGLDRAEIVVKRIAMFRDKPDDIRTLEQFYGPAITKQLRTIAKKIESTHARHG